MKAITVYQSTDSSQWGSQAEALARDALNILLARRAKRKVVELCREQFPQEEVFKHEPAEDIHPRSYAGRFLDDVGGPLKRIWSWFSCERDGWVYSQPFYANTEWFEEAKSDVKGGAS